MQGIINLLRSPGGLEALVKPVPRDSAPAANTESDEQVRKFASFLPSRLSWIAHLCFAFRLPQAFALMGLADGSLLTVEAETGEIVLWQLDMSQLRMVRM